MADAAGSSLHTVRSSLRGQRFEGNTTFTLLPPACQQRPSQKAGTSSVVISPGWAQSSSHCAGSILSSSGPRLRASRKRRGVQSSSLFPPPSSGPHTACHVPAGRAVWSFGSLRPGARASCARARRQPPRKLPQRAPEIKRVSHCARCFRSSPEAPRPAGVRESKQMRTVHCGATTKRERR